MNFAYSMQVNFLRMIDRKAPVLYEKNVVENAIRRYETYWLPAQVPPFSSSFLSIHNLCHILIFQALKPDLNKIPPLDVHWV
jgi:hypothetical protein